MRAGWHAGVRNIWAITRREFVARADSRGFIISTLVLMVAAVALALAPVIISYVDRGATQTVGVHAGADDLRADPVTTLDALFNGTPGAPSGSSTTANGRRDYTFQATGDVAAGREAVRDGTYTVLVDIERDLSGQLVFTVYADDPTTNRSASLIRQAAASIAIADRLARLGLSVDGQAQLFALPPVTLLAADPAKPAPSGSATIDLMSGFSITFGLVIFLLLAVITYGTWIAMSVVEEKSSRVMEVILSAASPFELLAGKVLGVGGAALLQFSAMLGAALVALALQGEVASLVLGEGGGLDLPKGLTPAILAVFSVYFVLGFLLYAVLFAAAGSLVSRQEDVNQVVLPMTLLATAGYLIGLYASIGFVDADATWVVALSWVPFLAPYMMLGRLDTGTAGAVEVVGSVLLMVVTIVAAIWVAARIYRAGVLLYGQRPGVRRMWRAIREGG